MVSATDRTQGKTRTRGKRLFTSRTGTSTLAVTGLVHTQTGNNYEGIAGMLSQGNDMNWHQSAGEHEGLTRKQDTGVHYTKRGNTWQKTRMRPDSTKIKQESRKWTRQRDGGQNIPSCWTECSACANKARAKKERLFGSAEFCVITFFLSLTDVWLLF